MAFVIQWTGPLGPATTQRDSPVKSLACATEMLEKGYTDAVIVDLARKRQSVCAADLPGFFWIRENNTPEAQRREAAPRRRDRRPRHGRPPECIGAVLRTKAPPPGPPRPPPPPPSPGPPPPAAPTATTATTRANQPRAGWQRTHQRDRVRAAAISASTWSGAGAVGVSSAVVTAHAD